MAVIVKYIVVRNGEEKMTFATKKEADAYDKMLDIADNLFEFLADSDLELSENQMEAVSLLLAENREAVIPMLRGVKPKPGASPSQGKKPLKSDKPDAKSSGAGKAEKPAAGSPGARRRQTKK